MTEKHIYISKCTRNKDKSCCTNTFLSCYFCKSFPKIICKTPKKRFLLHTKQFSFELFFRKQKNFGKISLWAVHFIDPYSKIRTAPGTNQNAPFIVDQFSHIIKYNTWCYWTIIRSVLGKYWSFAPFQFAFFHKICFKCSFFSIRKTGIPSILCNTSFEQIPAHWSSHFPDAAEWWNV